MVRRSSQPGKTGSLFGRRMDVSKSGVSARNLQKTFRDTDGGVSGFVGFALNQKGHSFFS